jgi:hypothetical protein
MRGVDSVDVTAVNSVLDNPAIDGIDQPMIQYFLFALGFVGASLPPGKNENSKTCR